MLREALKFHADQAQFAVNARSLDGSVTVGSPEQVDIVTSGKPAKNSSNQKIGGGSEVCGIDEKGDLSCGK